jgi:hypothetical protein
LIIAQIQLNHDCILGMAKLDGGVKISLNIDRVLWSEDLIAIDKTI